MKQPVEETKESSPILCNVIERNIATLSRLRERRDQGRNLENRMADGITDFSGRMIFVYVHIVWFGLWILLNTGRFHVTPFDRYPYGLLTMVVSLEAIFLSTFVLISQNRIGQQADQRADLSLQIDLLTEAELTRVLKMLDAIQDKMGIENDEDEELADLEREVHPEDVLEEIDRVQRRVRLKKARHKSSEAAAAK